MDAARALFIEQGYEQTAMSDIARRSGVAQGTFYIYFSAKQDVLAAIMRELLEELAGIIHGLAERRDLPAIAALRLATGNCLDRMSQESRLVEAVLLKAHYSLPAQLIEEYVPQLLPAITAIIERGVREGSMRVTHPRIAADFLWTVAYRFIETAAQQQMAPAEDGPAVSDLHQAFWEFALQALGVSSLGHA
ncbi:MAG: transcriptional regulator, TetR family [Symbiobacteriaceae bacterium]|nr:transcriptional regulator, TetR family [Symbiobacteriaceae bacterium]